MSKCKHDWRIVAMPHGGSVNGVKCGALWYCTKCRLVDPITPGEDARS